MDNHTNFWWLLHNRLSRCGVPAMGSSLCPGSESEADIEPLVQSQVIGSLVLRRIVSSATRSQRPPNPPPRPPRPPPPRSPRPPTSPPSSTAPGMRTPKSFQFSCHLKLNDLDTNIYLNAILQSLFWLCLPTRTYHCAVFSLPMNPYNSLH